jgi:hypothetical protein
MEELMDHPRVTEEELVLDWRFEALERAGYEPIPALALASSPHVDLHVAADLLANGCPGDTALRILL